MPCGAWLWCPPFLGPPKPWAKVPRAMSLDEDELVWDFPAKDGIFKKKSWDLPTKDGIFKKKSWDLPTKDGIFKKKSWDLPTKD